MSCAVQNSAGEPIFTTEDLEIQAAQSRPKGVLPRWMDGLPWPFGFVAAIELARERRSRDEVRPLYKQARAVLKAEKAGDTRRVARLMEKLRDRYDLFTTTVTVASPEVAARIADGTFDRAQYRAELEARYGEPVIDMTDQIHAAIADRKAAEGPAHL